MNPGAARSTAEAGASVVLQSGLPEFVPELVGLAGTLILLLLLAALGGFVYRSLTGGVDWPDEEPDEDSVSRSDEDDEWKYH